MHLIVVRTCLRGNFWALSNTLQLWLPKSATFLSGTTTEVQTWRCAGKAPTRLSLPKKNEYERSYEAGCGSKESVCVDTSGELLFPYLGPRDAVFLSGDQRWKKGTRQGDPHTASASPSPPGEDKLLKKGQSSMEHVRPL